jgi:hypothetical protein
MPDRRLLVIPALLIALVGGCSTDDGALSLVETKSPVQLLRNEAWFRLPDVMIKGDQETTDISVACNDDGTERSWLSRTTALINNSFAPRTDGVAKELVASFTSQGWTSTEKTDSESTEYTLDKENSLAVISVLAVEKTADHRASISISITGPCVMTAGPDSDEVRSLEDGG